MTNKSGAHMGNRFYILACMQACANDGHLDRAPSGAVKANSTSVSFFRMRVAERAINAVVRRAADPKIVGFPLRRARRQ